MGELFVRVIQFDMVRLHEPDRCGRCVYGKYTFERNCINGVAPYLLFTFQAVYLSLFFDAPEAFYRLLSTFYLLGGRFTVIFRCPETFLPLCVSLTYSERYFYSLGSVIPIRPESTVLPASWKKSGLETRPITIRASSPIQ